MTNLECGRQELCGACLDIADESGRNAVCGAVAYVPTAAEILQYEGPEDISQEELHVITAEQMILRVGRDGLTSEMCEAAVESATELFH